MNKANVIVLICLIVPLVLLIVSYSSNWYKVQSKSNSDIYTVYKAAHIKSVSPRATITIDWNDDISGKSHDIFKAALSFAVIAWIVNVVAVVFVVLSLLGILSKIPIPLGFVTKLLPIAIVVLCLISMFIFVGLPSAAKKDCEKNSPIDDVCDTDQNKKLVGSDDSVKWGPIEGWACVIISAAFALVASIVGLTMG